MNEAKLNTENTSAESISPAERSLNLVSFQSLSALALKNLRTKLPEAMQQGFRFTYIENSRNLALAQSLVKGGDLLGAKDALTNIDIEEIFEEKELLKLVELYFQIGEKAEALKIAGEMIENERGIKAVFLAENFIDLLYANGVLDQDTAIKIISSIESQDVQLNFIYRYLNKQNDADIYQLTISILNKIKISPRNQITLCLRAKDICLKNNQIEWAKEMIDKAFKIVGDLEFSTAKFYAIFDIATDQTSETKIISAEEAISQMKELIRIIENKEVEPHEVFTHGDDVSQINMYFAEFLLREGMTAEAEVVLEKISMPAQKENTMLRIARQYAEKGDKTSAKRLIAEAGKFGWENNRGINGNGYGWNKENPLPVSIAKTQMIIGDLESAIRTLEGIIPGLTKELSEEKKSKEKSWVDELLISDVSKEFKSIGVNYNYFHQTVVELLNEGHTEKAILLLTKYPEFIAAIPDNSEQRIVALGQITALQIKLKQPITTSLILRHISFSLDKDDFLNQEKEQNNEHTLKKLIAIAKIQSTFPDKNELTKTLEIAEKFINQDSSKDIVGIIIDMAKLWLLVPEKNKAIEQVNRALLICEFNFNFEENCSHNEAHSIFLANKKNLLEIYELFLNLGEKDRASKVIKYIAISVIKFENEIQKREQKKTKNTFILKNWNNEWPLSKDCFELSELLLSNGDMTVTRELMSLVAQKMQSGVFDTSNFITINKKIVSLLTSKKELLSEQIDYKLLKDKILINGRLNAQLLTEVGSFAEKDSIEQLLSLVPSEQLKLARQIIYRSAVENETGFWRANQELISKSTLALLTEAIANQNIEEVMLGKYLLGTINLLSTKEAKDALLGIARSLASQDSIQYDQFLNPHFMRILKTLAELDSFRGNDLIFIIAADENLPAHYSNYLFGKLTENKYLQFDINDWLRKRKGKRTERDKIRGWVRLPADQELKQERIELAAIKMICRLGAAPSSDILDYLLDREETDLYELTLEEVAERVKFLEGYKQKFETVADQSELIALLTKDKNAASAFYLLNNGRVTFDLVNNYSFDKFKEMLELIGRLQIHEQPILEFRTALINSGMTSAQADQIISNLKHGSPPFGKSSGELIRLDISDTTKLRDANRELADVLGSEQMGISFKVPQYRKYLNASDHLQAKNYLTKLINANSLAEATRLIKEIEKVFPDFETRLISDLSDKWDHFRKKSILPLTFESILKSSSNPVNGEEVIQALEQNRSALKRAKTDVIDALKHENPEIKRLQADLKKKQAVKEKLKGNLEKSPSNTRIIEQIESIDKDLILLEQNLKQIKTNPIAQRYDHLPDQEKRELLEKTKKELEALSQKDSSLVLLDIIVEIIGLENLNEGEVDLIKEVASHLESPIHAITDLAKLDASFRRKQRKEARLRLLDKKDDLITMLRFADSKICCFSSSNYEMRVAHGIPNKEWVASINKDPLSFVFQIEELKDNENDKTKNLGFVFGSFGVSSDGLPVVLLNGIYFSEGNDLKSVQSILRSVESQLSAPIKAQYQLLASKYGGSLSGQIPGYDGKAVTVKRLRALKGKGDKPETIIYDDLGTAINQFLDYSGSNSVTHKQFGEKIKPAKQFYNRFMAKFGSLVPRLSA